MATLRFRFLNGGQGSPRAVVYLDVAHGEQGLALGDTGWIAAATNLAAFEEELSRLETEFSEIRREAQLRFADHAAKRYCGEREGRVRLLLKCTILMRDVR